MPTKSYLENFTIGTSAQYRIRVLGGLDKNWSDRLAGMTIQTTHSSEHPKITTISGHLLDQAALSGVLSTLYELHLPLLSVENLDIPSTVSFGNTSIKTQ
jgi:hypothetical protein